VSAAVVLLAQGLGDDLAPWRRELAVDVAVPIVGVPIALSAAERTAASGWLVSDPAPVPAVLPDPVVPSLAAPVAAVVSDGFGVVVDVVGAGELEVGAGELEVGAGELEVGAGELEVGGLLVDELDGST
jgi:hypothetical protein